VGKPGFEFDDLMSCLPVGVLMGVGLQSLLARTDVINSGSVSYKFIVRVTMRVADALLGWALKEDIE
jgi:hypothetical protein